MAVVGLTGVRLLDHPVKLPRGQASPVLLNIVTTHEWAEIPSHRIVQRRLRSPVDPSQWGWGKEGGVHDHADMRRSIDSHRALPGFVVEERPNVRYVPGPKRRGFTWAVSRTARRRRPPCHQRTVTARSGTQPAHGSRKCGSISPPSTRPRSPKSCTGLLQLGEQTRPPPGGSGGSDDPAGSGPRCSASVSIANCGSGAPHLPTVFRSS